MNDIPDCAVVHHEVTMNQLIAEIDNSAVRGDTRCRFRCNFEKPIYRFPNYFELSLNSRAHHCVALIVRKVRVACELLDTIDSELNVVKYGFRFNLHTTSA